MRNQDFSRGHCQFVEEGTVLQSLAYNGSREWVYSPSPRIPEAWGAQGGVESSSSSSGRAGRAWWRETAECSPQHGSDTFQPPSPPPHPADTMPSVYFFLLCCLGNARHPQSLSSERSLLCSSAYSLASGLSPQWS